MRNRAVMAVTALAAVAALAASGCGSSDDDSSTSGGSTATGGAATTGGGAEKAPKVAMLVVALSDYQKAQQKGVEEVIKPVGGSTTVFNANFDPNKLTQQCNDAINSGRYNVIMLNPPDPPLGIPCARAAAAKNIPVLGLFIPTGKDPNSIEPQVDGVVGGVIGTPQGNAEARVAQVKAACEGIDPCKVIAEQGTATDAFSNDPIKAVEELPNVEVVAKYVGNYDPTLTAKNLPDLLNANRDVNVFMPTSDDSAIAAIPVLKKLGMQDQIKNLGSGAKVQALDALKSGELFSETGSWPLSEGKALGKMAIQAVNGQPVDPESIDARSFGPELIDKSNVNEVTPEWGSSS